MSNKICKGCGVVLQSSDAAAIGYTPKMEADYCQRCFRIRHYDDVVISMKQGIDSDAVLQKINAMDALVVWVVDLFDFESNLLPGINRHLLGKDILMVATKRDLLPATLGNEKLSQFLLRRLKEEGILVQGIVVCGDLAAHARREDNASVDEVCAAIAHYRKERDVVVMGMANAGKSTLLKLLMGQEISWDGTFTHLPGLSISYVPQDTSNLRGSLHDFVRERNADETLLLAILRKLDFPRVQFEKDMANWSAGQKKKALIACSLCESAHLYLWDEPLNYLDVWSRMQIEQLLLAFQPTLLFVEHDETFRQTVATRQIELL